MNITQIIVKGIFLIHVYIGYSSIEVQNFESINNNLQQQISSSETILGVWRYTMSNVESPYKKGVLFISKNEDTYDVVIQYPTGALTGQDVVIDNGRVNFNINIAGLERVSFVLMVEGDRITGESYSKAGSSQFIGARQLPVR